MITTRKSPLRTVRPNGILSAGRNWKSGFAPCPYRALGFIGSGKAAKF